MTNEFTAERWRQFWSHYRDEPQQREGIEVLRQAISQSDPAELTETADWVAIFHRPAEPTAAATHAAAGQLIKVPYFNQLLMDDGQGWRDCFSATCAMIAAWAGKVLPDSSGENHYNHIRQKHGDSTVAGSQVAALAELGLKAHYSTTGNKSKLLMLLDQGIPVGLGILHHGRVTSPTGGGHWILAVGYDDSGLIVNDPYGNLGLVSGQWEQVGSGGDHTHYSYENLIARWEVSGGDGYMIWASQV